MEDLFSAMLVLALCAVMLVTGQQFLSKMPEITAATSVPRPQVVASGSPADVR